MEVSGPPLILADCNVLCLRRRSSRSADVGQNIFFLQIMSVARLREIYFFIFNVVKMTTLVLKCYDIFRCDKHLYSRLCHSVTLHYAISDLERV